MSNVHSTGVGGSSVIRIHAGRITVGPHSVGAAPGPACFGFGGRQATITDVNLLLGVLDPDTYLDGTFTLDADRARAVIIETVAEPLGISLEEALIRMEQAYFEALSGAFAHLVEGDTTLAAFGGAGPMSAAGAARPAGVQQVLVPRTAAVFSALGISFSDIGKTYEVGVPEPTTAATAATHADLLVRAERDMYQEGYALAGCRTDWQVSVEDAGGRLLDRRPYRAGDAVEHPGRQVSLQLTVTAPLPHPELPVDREVAARPAPSVGTRKVRSAPDQVDDVPVHVLDELAAGDGGHGPAIVEGPFFTARVLPGWTFRVTAAGDLLLHDTL